MEAMKWDKGFDIVKYRDEHFAGDSGLANFPESAVAVEKGTRASSSDFIDHGAG
jgi:hypothetical protein